MAFNHPKLVVYLCGSHRLHLLPYTVIQSFLLHMHKNSTAQLVYTTHEDWTSEHQHVQHLANQSHPDIITAF